MMTDPIADMLTRIRNANQMKHETVLVPASKVKAQILEVLKNEGFINNYELIKEENDPQGNFKIELKYLSNHDRVIKGLKRISKPGLRVYAQADNLPKVLNGLGIAVISTSKGIMTDKEARKQQIGGEVIAYVW